MKIDRKSIDFNRQIIMEDDFETIDVEQQDVATIANQCAYVKKLLEVSKLHVLQPGSVISAYKDRKECGLFHLFMKKNFLKTTLRSWTNSHLIADGKKEVSQTKFLAYIGLEMAMSIAQFNTVEEYWKRDMFLGHKDFQRVMSRDDFQNIRSHMKFVPPSMSNDGEVAALDPLWHSRKLLEP